MKHPYDITQKKNYIIQENSVFLHISCTLKTHRLITFGFLDVIGFRGYFGSAIWRLVLQPFSDVNLRVSLKPRIAHGERNNNTQSYQHQAKRVYDDCLVGPIRIPVPAIVSLRVRYN